MTDLGGITMLEYITVNESIRELRPDFAVLALTAEGLGNGPSDELSTGWLQTAGAGAVPADPHVQAWREAYTAFGAKPKRTRPSIDALLRRADTLPAVNRIVDAYNAISVEYALPIGGEDLDAYQGPARLVRATGTEPFDTTADGAPAVEYPVTGEVVWRDDEGVTCRRWNWRQCTRTRITASTKNGLFLLERLEPYPLERLHAAGQELAARLRAVAPEVRIESRLIGLADH
jgi:DNA/RNA-binding domain of Phe-tRNA-synthetase-like protein